MKLRNINMAYNTRVALESGVFSEQITVNISALPHRIIDWVYVSKLWIYNGLYPYDRRSPHVWICTARDIFMLFGRSDFFVLGMHELTFGSRIKLKAEHFTTDNVPVKHISIIQKVRWRGIKVFYQGIKH